VSFTWNFNDGNVTTTSDPVIIHAFGATGTYNVTLTLEHDGATTFTEWAIIYVAPKPYFRIEPETADLGLLNKEFQINITLNDLDANQRAIAVQFRLLYNGTLLRLMSITEGPFMKQAGATWFVYANNTGDPYYGDYAIVGILIMPNATGQRNTFPAGNGTLATITFKAILQERGLSRPPLSCDFKLIETLIVDDSMGLVTHIVQNGVYRMHPTNIADVNYDGKVDITDLAMASAAFGSYPGHPQWNPACDINSDRRIDIIDVAMVSGQYGWFSQYDP
jgi:PKD repeat protein